MVDGKLVNSRQSTQYNRITINQSNKHSKAVLRIYFRNNSHKIDAYMWNVNEHQTEVRPAFTKVKKYEHKNMIGHNSNTICFARPSSRYQQGLKICYSDSNI
jgi:hypothetical protein